MRVPLDLGATRVAPKLWPALVDSRPATRLDALVQLIAAQFEGSASAVTIAGKGGHRLVAAVGYEAKVLNHVLADFVSHDPGWHHALGCPETIVTWHDIPGYQDLYTPQEILMPAGFREGSSIPLTNSTGVVLGAVHLSVREPAVPAALLELVSALLAYATDAAASLSYIQRAALTSREIEVLGLVVQGHSNAAIAEVLYVSLSTVNTHVEHILSKLDASTRVAASVRAVRLGLVAPATSC